MTGLLQIATDAIDAHRATTRGKCRCGATWAPEHVTAEIIGAIDAHRAGGVDLAVFDGILIVADAWFQSLEARVNERSAVLLRTRQRFNERAELRRLGDDLWHAHNVAVRMRHELRDLDRVLSERETTAAAPMPPPETTAADPPA